MARSIVFLMPVAFTDYHARRYGLCALEDKGITTYVFDLSQLFNRGVFDRNDAENPQEARVYRISAYAELDKKIKDLSKEAVFVDYLVGLSGIDIKHEKVFRILKKHGAKYYVISDGDLPTPFADNDSKKYSKMFKARDTGHYITKVILRLSVKLGFYPLPVKVFGTESENVKNYLRKYDNGSIARIPVNSFDYSLYLEYMKRNNGGSHSGQICVFLDEDAVYSRDFDILKTEKLDGKSYFTAMNRLFDKIERETGLEVVIAAHPRSHYEEYPGVFGSRKIIKGRTVELVAQSSLVVMHSSTAVSYPVLFNKPLLIVKTEDMIQNKYDLFVDALGRELGLETVKIEDKEQFENLALTIKNPPVNRLNQYKYSYLVSQGLEDLTTWDVIARELKKEHG